MQDYQLIERKVRTLLKVNHSDKLLGRMTNTETTTTSAEMMLNKTKRPKEINPKILVENDVDFDTVKRSKSEYSIKECGGQDRNGRRSNSLHDMWSNEIIINPKSFKRHTAEKSKKTFLINIWKISETACCQNHWRSDLIDILLRIFAVLLFIKLETSNAFKRKIHMEELWLYQNPMMPDIVTPTELLLAVILIPWLTSLFVYYVTKDKKDYRAANWVWTLALCINGLTTSMFKISSGRPRPDFFYRCFPDGVMVLNNVTDSNGVLDMFNCTGNTRVINEGRKSFPSGHSSFAFTSFSFVTFYLGTKLHAFDSRGRGQTWRLVLSLLPLVAATLIAISRTCDYHHHWQDVFVGAIIGLLSSYLCYRQYYPSIFDENSDVPLPRFVYSKCLRKSNIYKRIPDSDPTDENIENTTLEENSLLYNSN